MTMTSTFDAQLDPRKVVDADILSDDVRQNWEAYSRQWAGRSPFYSFSNGVAYLVVASYADVLEVFHGSQSDRFSTSPDAAGEAFAGKELGKRAGAGQLFAGLPLMNNMGVDDHRRVRRAVQPAFGAHGIGVHADFIEDTVERLLDAIEAKGGEFDAMADFGRPVIREVLLHGMLGVAPDHVEPLLTLASQLPEAIKNGPTPEFRRAFDGVIAIGEDMLERGRDDQRDDFIGRLVSACHAGTISRDEFLGQMMTISTGGLSSTAGATGMLLYHKSRYADQFEKVQRDPELLPAAVDESLRMHPASIVVAPRFALEETEIGGTTAYPGMPILACVPLANNDPAVFERPYDFELGRTTKHVTFGKGMHVCIGSTVARKITTVSLRRFLARFPGVRLSDPEYSPVYEGFIGEFHPRELPMQLA